MNIFKNLLYGSLVMASLTTVPAFAQNTLPEGSLKMIVTPHNQSINSYERTLCLNIKANVKYTVSSDQSWVKVRKGSDNSVYVHVDQNYAMEARSANVEFVSNDGKISQTLVVTQAADGSAAELPTDVRIYPSSATDNTHANSGSDGGVAYTYDNDLSTLYHSAYSPSKFVVSQTNPAILTYNFKDVSNIDYMTYVPRQSGTNGNFGNFSVYYKLQGDTEYKHFGDFNNNGSNNEYTVKFNGALVNPISVQVRVYDGTLGYASCAEMKFMQDGGATTAFDIFADNLLTSLKKDVTLDQIEAISNPFVKGLALKLYDGSYDKKYRVAEFPCLLSVQALAAKWNVDGKYYDQMAGVTGISFAPGTYAIACEMPEGRTAKLKIVSWYNGKKGDSFDGGNPQTATFTLKNGLNVIEYQPTKMGLTYYGAWDDAFNGLGYIVYDDDTDPDAVAPLKVHFINAVVNGYLSEDLTNEEMHELTGNAKNSHMDVVSKKVHAVWSSKGLHSFCKSTTGGLGYKQYMNVLDSLIVWEHDVLGFTKYNLVPKNRTFAYVNYTYYMFQGGLGVSFHVDQESRVLNCNTLINRDDDAIWGLSHEWGHQHQLHPYFCWTGTTEVTNNVNSYYNVMKMGYRTSDKIDAWKPARKHFIDDNLSGVTIASEARKKAYDNVGGLSWNSDYYALGQEMKDNTIVKQSENLVKGLSIHEVGVGETLCPYIMLNNYFTVVKNMPDFTPDMYEALRQTDKDGGSNIEKKDGVDKYELVASAQNNDKNNGLARLKAAYPNSIWTKYITAGHTSRNTNSMPFVLNYIRKASRLSGYNLFPFFERWGFLRQVAMYIGDYGNGWCVFPKAAYDEFKADMDELVAKGVLKEMPEGMVEEISNTADRFMPKPVFPN